MPIDLSPSEQLPYTTVRIECDTPIGRSTGTGFYFEFCRKGDHCVPAIVTNKHVIAGSTTGRFHLHLSENSDSVPTTHTDFIVTDFQTYWIGHPNADIDLCVMPISHLLRFSEEQGKMLFYIPMDERWLLSETDLTDLTAIEEVVMVGYPNGIWDHVNNMPLFRRGVTATHPNTDYCGRREFMIDAACFPGSSGSPVLLYNSGNYTNRKGNVIFGSRIMLMGVLYAGPQHTATGEIVIETIPTVSKPVAISRIPNNLGLIIKAELLKDFEALLQPPGGSASE